ncbi:hypothetical protein Nepgr_008357 [Nepenthes gracilis]|uniref:Uncharacterized protein n=1 Tax=Nepenthes gracilis TaxID=150966 RepID=A0AAD3S8L3_NEPGR|nr:hypothetical protein Nepgr_008357 [Nepenthes gracilis]
MLLASLCEHETLCRGSILESSKATNLYQRQFMEHQYLYLWMLMNALEIEEYNWKLGGKAAKLLFCLTLRQFWLLSLDQLVRASGCGLSGATDRLCCENGYKFEMIRFAFGFFS